MTDAARRVVVTGLGVVSPLGNDVGTFWDALVSGRSGVGPITKFDPAGLGASIAAEVKSFDPGDHADGRTVRTSDASAVYLLAAARESLRDAGLEQPPDPAAVGVIVGFDVAHASIYRAVVGLERSGRLGVDAYALLQALPAMPGSLVAHHFGLRGAQHAVSAACASGAVSLLQARNLIELGYVDAVVAGCTSALDRLLLASCSAARVLSGSDDPTTASRPFDRLRDGFVIGEGSAAIVLEELGHARRRQAPIYAEFRGGAQTSSLAGFTVNPADDCADCLQRALSSAGTAPSEVDAVCAHATSTPVGDRQEAEAIRAAFGSRPVPAFAPKSAIGHCVSAGAGIETVAALLALRDGIAPPTLNYTDPDPACPVDCVPNEARRLPMRVVVKNSFGFAGVNCCLVFSAWEE